ncbi:MAG: peptidylprolyl isomerase [Acidobacteriia bacterium]|nr:peptidylprolyl isomerase [Terriglobia bacterium]
MKFHFLIGAVLLISLSVSGQVASHAPTVGVTAKSATPQPAGQPVARVNGAVLTDRDLQREIFTIFPYARQHGGNVPKELEPDIRKGALQMIIFEELVYQEALQRKMTVSPERLSRAQAEFRKQFSTPDEYQNFLQTECHGSQQAMREKIRRSLLIEQLLKLEVDNKSTVSVAEAKAFYDKNPGKFQYPESFAIQTISFLPPEKATPSQVQEARKRAEEALPKAKATKTYEEFGLLAEKVSEDDYRVMMGDHKTMDRSQIAPAVAQALQNLQPGQITNLVQVENAFTIVRLNKHTPAGQFKFEEVKDKLRKQLEQKKTNQVRADLNKKLTQKAKIEVL